ncbi:MAG: hypothetical protein IID39_09515, partial [Planctomycetes bacterium]|nr:hypothetical protein [Planctomycetota bacterium]
MALIRSVSGVRGLVRADRAEAVTMTANVANRMGQAYATYLARLGRTSAGSFLVGGRDGRVGGERLLGAFIDGAETLGLHVLDLGVVTTPGVAMMVKHLRAAGGVVITASHNPVEWNGIKLLTAEGEAPTGHAAQEVFDIYDAGAFRTASPAGARPVSEVNPH